MPSELASSLQLRKFACAYRRFDVSVPDVYNVHRLVHACCPMLSVNPLYHASCGGAHTELKRPLLTSFRCKSPGKSDYLMKSKRGGLVIFPTLWLLASMETQAGSFLLFLCQICPLPFHLNLVLKRRAGCRFSCRELASFGKPRGHPYVTHLYSFPWGK